MKKIFLFFYLLFFVLLVSCDNYKNYKLDGMWQLKTVEHADGSISQVDSVYYGFQRELIFSFTVVTGKESTSYSYGYMDFLDDKTLEITMDITKNENDHFVNINWWLMQQNGWEDYHQVFTVEKYDSKTLTLSRNQVIYSFIKF